MNHWYSVYCRTSTGCIESNRCRTMAARLAMPQPFRLYPVMIVSVICLLCTGCYSWSPASQIRQCQMESDRLLAEFRAQKKRADEMESKYQLSQKQLAQTEKMLARQQNGFSGSSGMLADRSSNSGSNSSLAGRPATSGKDMEKTPPLSPSRTSGVYSSEDSDRNIQWRPQGTPLR